MPAAGDDDVEGLIEAQASRRPGRADLAHAVAEHRRRRQAGVLQHADRGDLQGKNQRLGIGRPAKLRAEIVGEQGLDQGPLRPLGEMAVDLGQGVAKTSVGLPGGPSHPGPLRAVAGKDEGHRQVVAQRLPGQGVRTGVAPGEAVDLLPERLDAVGADDRAVRQPVALMAGGTDEVGDKPWILRPVVDAGGGDLGQRLVGVGGEQQRRAGCSLAPAQHAHDRIVTAQDDVRVGAAEAEGIDAREVRRPPVRKAPGVAQYAEIELVEGNIGIRRLLVQGRRNQALVQRQNGFQHAGQTGCRLEVPDVRFDRADRQGLRPFLPQRLAQRIGLDGVADPGARAMGLDEAEIFRGHPGVAVDLLQDGPLRIRGWQ